MASSNNVTWSIYTLSSTNYIYTVYLQYVPLTVYKNNIYPSKDIKLQTRRCIRTEHWEGNSEVMNGKV